MGRLAEWLDQLEFLLSIPTNVAFALRQCLEEAVVNLIDYTPATEGEDIAVEVGWQCDCLVATVEDPGPPFDLLSAPVPVPALSLKTAVPGGWGIHLIRCFANQIGYETIGGRNRLRLTFSRITASADDFP